MKGDQTAFMMMVAMAAMCAVPLVLLAVLPAVGTLAGAVVAIGIVAAMLLIHLKFMRHGHGG